jgi:radical SAM superfamily enzyme YgiQ (UPF0313 family)
MIKNKIFLINPRSFNPYWIPHTGLFYIATMLKQNGYDIRVFDCNFLDFDIYKILEEEKPWVVGISCFSASYSEAMKIAKFAKEKTGAITVIGGVHVSMTGEKVLQNSFIDFAVIGAGEYPFLQLIQAIINNSSTKNISGLGFKEDGSIMINTYQHISDLDKLPFPNYGLGNISRMTSYPLVTSRGCPHNCIFCCECRATNKKWIARSPENIIEEIMLAQQNYSPKEFVIIDENFSLDIKRAKEFCLQLINKKLNITWSVDGGLRADNTDKEMFLLMKKSGCKRVTFGIESTNEEVFKHLKKGETLEDIKNAIIWAAESEIERIGFFIIGLPYSTFRSDMQSLEFIKRFRLNSAVYSIATPYYGTELYDWVKNYACLLREPIDNSMALGLNIEPFFEMPNFRKSHIKKAYVVCNLRMKKYFFMDCRMKLLIKDFIKILILSCKYDILYMPIHFVNLTYTFFKIIRNLIYRKVLNIIHHPRKYLPKVTKTSHLEIIDRYKK